MRASAKSFINTRFVKRYKLLLLELSKFIKLRLINKELIEVISYIIKTILFFEDYIKELYYLITSLIKFDVILDIF